MRVEESDGYITVPLFILSLGGIFVGYLGKELMLSSVLPPVISGSVKLIPL